MYAPTAPMTKAMTSTAAMPTLILLISFLLVKNIVLSPILPVVLKIILTDPALFNDTVIHYNRIIALIQQQRVQAYAHVKNVHPDTLDTEHFL